MMSSRLTDLPPSGKTLPLDDHSQVFFPTRSAALAPLRLPEARSAFRQGAALTPYPPNVPAAWKDACRLAGWGHGTSAELTGGLEGFTEVKVWGTGLGNISEQGKERMPRQRLVWRRPQSLHGKVSRAAGMVSLSSPGTRC